MVTRKYRNLISFVFFLNLKSQIIIKKTRGVGGEFEQHFIIGFNYPAR
jgi:hypothetical protein